MRNGTKEKEEIRSIRASIESMIINVPPLSSEYSIYRVPERLRNVKEECYTPVVVSIGPLHHGKEKLQSMEYHKARYLYFLLHRQGARPLDDYIERLMSLERKARNCYAETILFTREEFVKMLLLDGCFVVEVICQYNMKNLREEHDQLSKNPWILNAVHRDMLLLENQIPFFILEKLFMMTDYSAQTEGVESTFLDFTKKFLCRYKIVQDNGLVSDNTEGDHMVQLLLRNFTRTIPNEDRSVVNEPVPDLPVPSEPDLAFIPSATELKKAGITFQPVKSSNLLSATFNVASGELFIPPLTVDDRTESFFRNLIALEQSQNFSTDSIQSSTKLSDYVTLLDCLINTSADVELLRDKGIINNHLGDNEEVAQLFNKLRNGIITDSRKFYFSKLFLHVNNYYKKRWHAWKARLRRDYFNTPWAYIAFFSAVLLLSLSVIQTISSILQVEKI
ncbi:hypothetical protein ACHQM5_008886 [Ranunculus cassubicifolius]